MLGQIAHFLRMIRFSHTLFALPFAVAQLAVIAVRYADRVTITWQNSILIVIAFTAMRSFAMAANRLIDREIDARNPRTANREIPAGKLSAAAVGTFGVVSLAALLCSAWLLAPIAAFLALPAATIVATYSYAKRFTWLCHLWLGVAISMAPIAVSIALLQTVTPESWFMALTLCFYIAGFDILYALQDIEFDGKERLFSIPARFGAARAVIISRALHLVSLSFCAVLIAMLALSIWAWVLYGALVFLLVYEHYLVGSVKNIRFEKIPVAFFNVNSIFSLTYAATIAIGLI
ncbi:UbiA-like polyprenyltransferase [Turneriella parva]|uniref:4-hydroxybenzoate polyprenyltransferase n=1 Tax=Turneriella parva (strain ATCC BAA-1111 / DSM 21527 / NCTC 11395 / H) TaxID=869212 RepID=I4B0V9_TURPD|nr:UbiA-like polyprenyltransferase [Turneriella parva]AFM10916.1 4-hydroxybenzoate polyprenyltransferase [Turneriella parva DSM 21527]